MPDLSVVVPVHNERDNIVPLLTEIASALRGKADFEIVYVDDREQGRFTWPCSPRRRRSFPSCACCGIRAKWTKHRVAHRHQGCARRLDRHARWRRPERSGRHSEADRDARRIPGRDQAVRRLARRTARTPAASAGPRSGPMRSVRACCATKPPTPAAASSCSSARCFSTCRTSTTCIATCRRWCSAPAGR